MAGFIQSMQGAVLTGMLSVIIVPPAFGQDTHALSEQSPSVAESVTTTVRCKEGTVVSRSYQTSRADINIVEEGGVDCDAEGCHAWMVTAKSDNEAPFTIMVNLVCTGDGLDTELDRMQEAVQQQEEGQ